LICLGFVLVGGCRAAPIPEAQRYPAATSLVPRYVTVGGSRIRYIEAGQGPAVVLIHGLAASMYSWRYAIVPLSQAGYRVIAYDNRGFGFSDKPANGYTNAEYVQLLFGLLDSLHVPEAVLVGHSMGGAIAAEAALTQPERVRALVLVDAAGLGVRWPFMLRVARWPFVAPLFDRLRGRGSTARILRSTYADASRVTSQDIDQYYAPVALPEFGRSLRGVLLHFRFDSLQGRLGSVVAPALVMWGAQDNLISPSIGEAMVSQLPHASLVRFPAAGHALPEEAPDRFNRVLLGFLKTGLPAPPENLVLSGGGLAHRRQSSYFINQLVEEISTWRASSIMTGHYVSSTLRGRSSPSAGFLALGSSGSRSSPVSTSSCCFTTSTRSEGSSRPRCAAEQRNSKRRWQARHTSWDVRSTACGSS
jgi:pimeloyl-ACP methyl ester carboxylesterase